MNARKILFPTDFSAASQAAMQYATALARDSGATLLIVHVEDLTPVMEDGLYLPPASVPNPEIKKMLEQVLPSDQQVPTEHILMLGTPATDILRLAEEHNVDMIVMGTHGRTGLGRMLMGSVAESIVRRAPCPVLTVKEKQDAAIGE
jgi:nucleotide-binding universal stress UspA family protein